jgi:hypothetical protein
MNPTNNKVRLEIKQIFDVINTKSQEEPIEHGENPRVPAFMFLID